MLRGVRSVLCVPCQITWSRDDRTFSPCLFSQSSLEIVLVSPLANLLTTVRIIV